MRHRPPAWYKLCVCGHLDRYHSPTIGGTFEVVPTEEKTFPDGRRMVYHHVVEGCRGAMVNRGQSTVRDEREETEELITRTETFVATCPCDDFRPVAKVDQPNRSFNQRMPDRPRRRARHPFQVGIRAFSTHLSDGVLHCPTRPGPTGSSTAGSSGRRPRLCDLEVHGDR